MDVVVHDFTLASVPVPVPVPVPVAVANYGTRAATQDENGERGHEVASAIGGPGHRRHGHPRCGRPVDRVSSRSARAADTPSEGVLFGVRRVSTTPNARAVRAARGRRRRAAPRGRCRGGRTPPDDACRRSEDGDRMPLAPKLVMAEARGVTRSPSPSPSSSPRTTRRAASRRRCRPSRRSRCRPHGSWSWRTTARTGRWGWPVRRAWTSTRPSTTPTRGRRSQPGAGADPPRSGRQRLRDDDGRRHHARRRLPQGAPSDSPTTER